MSQPGKEPQKNVDQGPANSKDPWTWSEIAVGVAIVVMGGFLLWVAADYVFSWGIMTSPAKDTTEVKGEEEKQESEEVGSEEGTEKPAWKKRRKNAQERFQRAQTEFKALGKVRPHAFEQAMKQFDEEASRDDASSSKPKNPQEKVQK